MQRELLLEDLQLLAGDATLSSLTFVLNLTFPPVEWMLNREAQELVYKNAHHMATQKSRQPPQTTSIQPKSLKTPSEPHPNPNLTIPIFHKFPIFCLPVLRMLLIPSLHGTAVGRVRHSATASGLCFQLIEVLQDQLPTTLPWCWAFVTCNKHAVTMMTMAIIVVVVVVVVVAAAAGVNGSRGVVIVVVFNKVGGKSVEVGQRDEQNWEDSADFRCDAPSALALCTLTRLGETEIWAEWQLNWPQSVLKQHLLKVSDCKTFRGMHSAALVCSTNLGTNAQKCFQTSKSCCIPWACYIQSLAHILLNSQGTEHGPASHPNMQQVLVTSFCWSLVAEDFWCPWRCLSKLKQGSRKFLPPSTAQNRLWNTVAAWSFRMIKGCGDRDFRDF